MEPKLSEIAYKGLWSHNPAIVQLLGMCPLLAVSTTIINGASLGIATVIVMTISSGAVSALRGWIPKNVRIPIFMLIVASLVTAVDLSWNAYFHRLYGIIGIYVPLIVTNCIVLARIEGFAYRHSFLQGAFDGFMMGIGGALGLTVLGGIREIVGSGTIGQGIEWIVPNWHPLSVLPANYPGLLLAKLPSGAFLGLSLMVAAYNWLRRDQP
ncbi:electron transport complex subunit RsxE [Candidatus Ichthyocystis hellenicum]|uniref:electron transport complex subunit RsxE n=1 Tax=Candidatus Ichthyocystis hellenicum TaxID=1561003 RepID=UPI000AD13CE1|nr:electron transport complex subunit E [Candidatus Ichthyocystis hellenicum]